jgi:hypothetical protein
LIARGRRIYFHRGLVQDLLVAEVDLKPSRFIKRLDTFDRPDHRRPRLCAAEPLRNESAVHPIWPAMTTAAAIDWPVHCCVILDLNIPSYPRGAGPKSEPKRPPNQTLRVEMTD